MFYRNLAVNDIQVYILVGFVERRQIAGFYYRSIAVVDSCRIGSANIQLVARVYGIVECNIDILDIAINRYIAVGNAYSDVGLVAFRNLEGIVLFASCGIDSTRGFRNLNRPVKTALNFNILYFVEVERTADFGFSRDKGVAAFLRQLLPVDYGRSCSDFGVDFACVFDGSRTRTVNSYRCGIFNIQDFVRFAAAHCYVQVGVFSVNIDLCGGFVDCYIAVEIRDFRFLGNACNFYGFGNFHTF